MGEMHIALGEAFEKMIGGAKRLQCHNMERSDVSVYTVSPSLSAH